MTSVTTRLQTWLNALPLQNPVQRQMAALLQVILLGFLGLIVLVTLVLFIGSGSSAQEKSRLLVGNLFGFLVVLLPLVLLRWGNFHSSIWSIITVLMITPALAIFVVFDLPNNGGILFQFTLAIFLSSLLADRRILGLVFGLSAGLVVLGAQQLQEAGSGLGRSAVDTALNFIVFNGLITLLLDRFGGTLRTALTAALTRERELEGEIEHRRQAERTAFENEARYHHILDSMMEGCQIIDFDWRYVYVNDVVAAQGRRSPQELLHHTMMEMYPGIEDSELFTLLRRCMEERIPQRMENQFIFPDGGIGWFELSIQPAREGIFILSTDITEHKRSEQKLVKQNQRLKALREIDTAILAADSIEVIVGAALSHILELIECRRASLALIDWENREALMFDVKTEDNSFMPSGTRVPLAVSEDMLPILAENQPVVINDLTALPNPPPHFQRGIQEGFRSICVLPLFSQGRLIGMFNLSLERTGFFDEEKIDLGREVANQVAIAITQMRLIDEMGTLNEQLDQRVRERTLQLESANRELESFSYSVSHDLRAPLRAINGFSLALSTRHADSLGEQGIHYLNRILENTRHMGELIDDLLSLSRISRREMEARDVNLSVLAQEIAAELRAIEPERQVTFEIEDQLAVWGDAGLIRVVLHNLIGNAWKFTSVLEQAHIRFGAASSLEQGDGKSDEGETVYFVQDNGVGFDMAYVDKLFGAFQRLHSMAEFPGTGIGLATVQRIIHRHGGRIWADAKLDQGATFCFTLGGSDEKQ